MKLRSLLTGGAICSLLATASFADEAAELIINGEIDITVRAEAAPHLENLSEVVSGWVYRSDETQSLQADDFDNPAMLFVDEGIEIWNAVSGSEGKSSIMCELPRRQLWQQHSCGSPEPRSDQRLPCVSFEERKVERCAFTVPWLCARHTGRDICRKLERVCRTGALRRITRKWPISRRPIST